MVDHDCSLAYLGRNSVRVGEGEGEDRDSLGRVTSQFLIILSEILYSASVGNKLITMDGLVAIVAIAIELANFVETTLRAFYGHL
jgi:hypothetical protein